MSKTITVKGFAKIAAAAVFFGCSSNVQKPGPRGPDGPPLPPPPVESLAIGSPSENQEVIGDSVLSGTCVEGALVLINIDGYSTNSVQCANRNWSLSFSTLNGFSALGADETFTVNVNQTDRPSVSRKFKTVSNKGGTVEEEKFASCAEIKSKHPSLGSDEYSVTLGLAGEKITVFCDMDRESGGWTGLTAKVVYDHLRETKDSESLGPKIVNGENVEIVEHDSYSGIYCSKEKKGTGGHTAQYIFKVPFGYSEFYINEFFEVRPSVSGKNQINKNYKQTKWNDAQFEGSFGDISFGSPAQDKDLAGALKDMIVTSYARFESSECNPSQGCDNLKWPGFESEFSIKENFPQASTQTTFSIGWGAAGEALEGWCIWHTTNDDSDPQKQARIFFR